MSENDNKCPYGFIFGEEIDEHDECNKCKAYNTCIDHNDVVLLGTHPTIPKDFPEYDKKEMVNKPDHYGGTLVIEYLEALEALPGNRMNFSRTSAIKYISRAGMKFPDKEIEELEKVIWYMNREIERLKK